MNTPCEGPGCSESGTHTVTIDFPGEPREVWTVCRRHERTLKRQAVASRPKASPPKQEPTTTGVAGIHEQLPLHESLRAQSRCPGKGGWLVDTRAGDDYTKLLEGWGSRDMIYDREQDRYRELIKLHDGTCIESVARLSDHHD